MHPEELTGEKRRRSGEVCYEGGNHTHNTYHDNLIINIELKSSDTDSVSRLCTSMFREFCKSKGHDQAEEPPPAVNEAMSPEEQLLQYILQLLPIVVVSFREQYAGLVRLLLRDADIREWLFDTSHCHTFKAFNKGNVFKLGRVFYQNKLIDYQSDYLLNQLLEQSQEDTTYRKSMGNQTKGFRQIEKRIVTLICQNRQEMNRIEKSGK